MIYLVTVSGTCQVTAESAAEAAVRAEALIMEGWAPPALRVVDVEPLRSSMEKVLEQENTQAMGVAEASLRRRTDAILEHALDIITRFPGEKP